MDVIHNLLVAYRTRLLDILVTYCTSVYQHIQNESARFCCNHLVVFVSLVVDRMDVIHNLLVTYRTRLLDILVTYCTSVHQHIQHNTAQLSKPWQATDYYEWRISPAE